MPLDFPYTTFRAVSTGAGDSYSLTSAPTVFCAYYVSNASKTDFRYIHVYDAITPTGAIKMTMGIPFDSGANQEYSNSIPFRTGFSFAISASPTGITAVGAGEVVVNLFFQD